VFFKMTPCIQLLKKQKQPYILHRYEHDPACTAYGEEAVLKLGVAKERVFKTLVVQTDAGKLAVGVVPVSKKLNLKAMAKALGAKKVHMADAKEVENSTGYILGGVSPLGQKKRLLSIIDASALEFETIFVSAGKRGLEVELAAQVFQTLLHVKFENIAT
jgi:Cys-tRNA(Pro)/Cys-tRNA(Cys) deacylase